MKPLTYTVVRRGGDMYEVTRQRPSWYRLVANLHAAGLGDTQIARHIGRPVNSVRGARVALDLPANAPVGRPRKTPALPTPTGGPGMVGAWRPGQMCTCAGRRGDGREPHWSF